MKELEGQTYEIICIEVTFFKKNWSVVSAFRPPGNTNKHTFFPVPADLNIDTLDDSWLLTITYQIFVTHSL